MNFFEIAVSDITKLSTICRSANAHAVINLSLLIQPERKNFNITSYTIWLITTLDLMGEKVADHQKMSYILQA